MKILVGIAGLLLSACAHLNSPTVVVRDVTVVNVIDGSLGIRVPDDADVMDAAGGFLIPGLWDMHVHSVANAGPDMAISSVAAMDWHFPLFLAWGVTGVRNMRDHDRGLSAMEWRTPERGRISRCREREGDTFRRESHACLPEVIRRNWEAMLETDLYPEMQSVLGPLVPLYAENARLLNEAGVLLLAGTDVGIPTLIPGSTTGSGRAPYARTSEGEVMSRHVQPVSLHTRLSEVPATALL